STEEEMSDEVIANLKSLRLKENEANAEIVRHLSLLDKDESYRESSFSSLYSLCTSEKGLHYSEGAAYRRVQAARLMHSDPEVYEKLRTGKRSLCAAAEICRVKDEEAKKRLIEEAEGKSKTEVRVLVAQHLPVKEKKRESVRVTKTVVSSLP